MKNNNIGKLLGIALTLVAVGSAVVEIFMFTGVESARLIDWMFLVISIVLSALYWYLLRLDPGKGIPIIAWVLIAVLVLRGLLQ